MWPPCELTTSALGAAPEVIRARATYDGQKADIWSCGVMLYIMLFYSYPFERDDDKALGQYRIKKMLERILTVDYQIPAEPAVRYP
jgi:serine/threonine-protein kinase SRK2